MLSKLYIFLAGLDRLRAPDAYQRQCVAVCPLGEPPSTFPLPPPTSLELISYCNKYRCTCWWPDHPHPHPTVAPLPEEQRRRRPVKRASPQASFVLILVVTATLCVLEKSHSL